MVSLELYPTEAIAYDKGASDLSIVLVTNDDDSTLYLYMEVTDDHVVYKGEDIDHVDLWLSTHWFNYLSYTEDKETSNFANSDILIRPLDDTTFNWSVAEERKRYYLQKRNWQGDETDITAEDIAGVKEVILLNGMTHWRLWVDGSLRQVDDSAYNLYPIDRPLKEFTSLSSTITATGYTLTFKLDKRALGVLHQNSGRLNLRLDVTDVDKKGKTSLYSTDSTNIKGVPIRLDVELPTRPALHWTTGDYCVNDLIFVYENGDWQPYQLTEQMIRWFSEVGQLVLKELEMETSTLYFDNIPYQACTTCENGSFNDTYSFIKLSFSDPKLNGDISFQTGGCDGDNFYLTKLNHDHYMLTAISYYDHRGDGWGECGGCPERDVQYYITDSTGTLSPLFSASANEGRMTINVPGFSGEGEMAGNTWTGDLQTFVFDLYLYMGTEEQANAKIYLDFNEDYSEYSIRKEGIPEGEGDQ